MPLAAVVSCHVFNENINFIKKPVFSSGLKSLMYVVRNVAQHLSSFLGTQESVWFEYITSPCTH